MDSLNKLKTIKPNQEWKSSFRLSLAPYESANLGLPVFGITILGTSLFMLVIANAAVSSIPGQKLYSVKKGLERAQIGLSLNKSQRTKLELEFVGRRADELIQLGQIGERRDGRDVRKETFATVKSAKSKLREVANTTEMLSINDKVEVVKLLKNKVEAVGKAVSDLPSSLKSDVVSEFGEALDPTVIGNETEEKPNQESENAEIEPKDSVFRAPLDIKNPRSNSRYQQ